MHIALQYAYCTFQEHCQSNGVSPFLTLPLIIMLQSSAFNAAGMTTRNKQPIVNNPYIFFKQGFVNEV